VKAFIWKNDQQLFLYRYMAVDRFLKRSLSLDWFLKHTISLDRFFNGRIGLHNIFFIILHAYSFINNALKDFLVCLKILMLLRAEYVLAPLLSPSVVTPGSPSHSSLVRLGSIMLFESRFFSYQTLCGSWRVLPFIRLRSGGLCYGCTRLYRTNCNKRAPL